MKKYILLFLLGVFLINPVSAKEKFYIENYDSDITVDGENNYKIKERMDVFFTLPANGIFRKFPVEEEIVKLDGKKYKRNSDVSFKENSITDYSGLNVNSERIRMRLGKIDKKIKGKKIYFFDYKLVFEKKTNFQNELYFDIVSTQWNVDVKKVHFKITFPQKINTEKIKFSIGKENKVKHDERIKYTASDYVIEGDVPAGLKPNEGLVLNVGLSNEFYNNKTIDEQGIVILFSVLFGICLLGSVLYISINKLKPLIK